MDRASVFISYRRSDRDAADRLSTLLRERDVDAWYDALIPPSTDWREAIVEHLSTARVMVVLLSSAALESDELKKELAVAAGKRLRLLAVRLEDVDLSGAFAYELARTNWFDIFDNPLAGLAALADLLADIAKTPREADLEPMLQKWQERWRRLTGRRMGRWMGNNTLLVMLLVLMSAAELLFYERAFRPLKEMTDGGIAPLTAFFRVVFVATVGSPVLFFSLLMHGVRMQDIPLLATTAANTVILILLVRNLFSWVRLRLLTRRST